VNAEQGNLHDKIGECFRRVQASLRECGYDPLTLLTIGAIKMVDGQLASYDCCVQYRKKCKAALMGGHPRAAWRAICRLEHKEDPACLPQIELGQNWPEIGLIHFNE